MNDLEGYNLFKSARGIGMQGQNKQTRGTQNTIAPLQPTGMLKPTQPIGGITPLGTNKGPLKMTHDNIVKNVDRSVQAKFNTGPNRANNLTGLSNQPGMRQGSINNMLKQSGFGGNMPANNSYQNFYEKSADAFNQKFGNMTKRFGSFFGMDADSHVGTGVNTQVLFQDMKAEKPVEVACSGTKKKMMITGQK